MSEYQKNGTYDLEERTLNFAKNVRCFAGEISKSLVNMDDIKQIIRSSGSVGWNYIEANEAPSKKDFLMRIKICRKEAKESRYWLKLMETQNNCQTEKEALIQEATELMNIFGAILRKSENS